MTTEREISSQEREQRLGMMINDLLNSLDKIAVSKDMGFARAEAIRAIEAFQRSWKNND